ncbi:DUF2511 domain-containing protein [Winslowiella toletana]|uniref:DUF2511 domain-containing protein n=1 Tax=Winslowiella toletana TaxID=92490 RepID=UPI0028BE0FA0|nr:DUF2511 domain-containing protein [Winslowiella toletana]WNN42667.1 DUF2511 domain-containing protein [Winslowiella toletana]
MKKVVLLASLLAFSGAAFSKDNSEAVFKKDSGDEWPLEFDRAVLTCLPGGGVFVINPMSDTYYPLNGTAQGLVRAGKVEAGDIKSVWLDNPEFPGAKKSIDTLLDKGLELCD